MPASRNGRKYSNNYGHHKKISAVDRKPKESRTISVEDDPNSSYAQYYESHEPGMLSHHRSYQESPSLMEVTSMSRNPEVESLVIKLRQKEKEKYERAEAPKYIDQMIIKHEKLLKMIDTRSSGKWKQTGLEFTERRIEDAKSKAEDEAVYKKFSSLVSSKADNYPNMNPNPEPVSRVIKLKKIEDIIARTKQNNLNLQKQQPLPDSSEGTSKRSKKIPEFIYASLRNSKIN